MDNYLEPEFAAPYQAWKAAPSATTSATLLRALQPTIDQAVRTHTGESGPLLTSRARRLALESLPSYDPTRARLRTHLYSQLQGLKRIQRQQNTILRVPERVALDRYHLDRYTNELAHELGRTPTDAELSDRTGFSATRLARVRGYRPAVAEGTLLAASGEVFGGAETNPPRTQAWQRLIYADLSPTDQQIMEHTFGLHGRRPLSNQETARKLGLSPGRISQRKKAIQALLDQEDALSPF